MKNLSRLRPRCSQYGLSIVELMVALTIGLIVLAAMSGVFIGSNHARNEMQKSTQQQENGRYAAQLLSDNLMLAGYLAEFNPTPLTTPAALPDPCATSIADLLTALPLHVQGINNGATTPTCISDLKAGTDILVVRRVSSCVAGAADCDAYVAGTPHFQASLCTPTDGSNVELAHAMTNDADYAAHYFALSNTALDFTRRKTDCVTQADIQRYLVYIYYIANNNESGDGIPTLKRAQLGADAFAIVPQVDGIEDMQIEYGIDNNNDGSPDAYTPAPAATSDWRNVVTARIHLLARNSRTTQNYIDNRSYTMGREADGTNKVLGPLNDGYKRHVYSTTVQLANPSWRRQ